MTPASDLLSVEAALEAILAPFTRLSAETVDLEAALGRVLAHPVIATDSLPPFANSSMDGYAVRAADTASAPAALRVVADARAGVVIDRTIESGEAARIMTGAPLPAGADAVVPVEDTDQSWASGEDTPLPAAVTVLRAVGVGASVRPVGEDVRAGDAILPAGHVLRPADIGMLAALGQAGVIVHRRPRAVVISTGDELLTPDQPLVPGKIRDANAYMLASLIRDLGGDAIRLPIARDTLDSLRACFDAAIAAAPDLIISSAGVSVGAFDIVRRVLAEYGSVTFWRVNVRPGKPLAYGSLRGIPFFGLPGNPVSAWVTFDVFVRPAILRLSGSEDVPATIRATLAEDVPSDGRRSYIRVLLDPAAEGSGWRARITGTQSSGALSSMVRADGLLILPEGTMRALAGEIYPVRLLRPLV